MHYKGIPYYVGLLSAASYYGATHHAVMETQVLIPGQIRTRILGAARFHFL
jgi:hypothetical protein